jgi:hypothetical protein
MKNAARGALSACVGPVFADTFYDRPRPVRAPFTERTPSIARSAGRKASRL